MAADQAPTQFVNLIDSFTASDVFRACASWCGWLWKRNTAYLMEKVMRGEWQSEGAPYNTGTRINYPHAHAEQSSECGITIRRALVNQSYNKGSDELVASYQTNLDDAWEEIDRWPVWPGGFKKAAGQVRYSVNQGGVRFRLKYCNHTFDGACSSTIHSLEEVAEQTSTTITNHLITGSLDGSASTIISNMTIDGPTSVTTPGDTTGAQEFVLEAQKTQATTATALKVYHFFAWERLSTD
jgi:hypothetical protein